jgi:outer membrane protein assembly factor BamB
MTIRRALVPVALTMALGGCWLQQDFGPARQNFNAFETGLTAANVGTLREAWTATAPSQDQPLVTPHAVFAGQLNVDPAGPDRSFTVRAVARGSGAPLWTQTVPVLPRIAPDSPSLGVAGLVSADRDEVVIASQGTGGTFGTAFHVFDPLTGAPIATRRDPRRFVDATSVAMNGGTLAYRAADVGVGGQVLVVRSRATFEELWSAPLPGEPATADLGGPLVIAGDRLFVRGVIAGTGAKVVHAFALSGCGAATCAPVWTAEVPPPASAGFDSLEVRLVAAADDGHLLLRRSARLGGVLQSDDLVVLTADGAPAWSTPLLRFGTAAIAGDRVVLTGTDVATPAGHDTVMALSLEDGALLWRADVPGSAVTATVVAGELAYVANGSRVRAFGVPGCGSPSCPPLAEIALARGPVTGIAVTFGTLFVGHNNVVLAAYAPTG